MSADKILCQLCLTNLSRYTCPRCHQLYCSLPCFQSRAHSQCSEAFYRSCVEEELRAEGGREASGGEDSKTRMMRILQKFEAAQTNAEDDDDDDDESDELPPLSERLRGLDLDGGEDPGWVEAVLSTLTPKENKSFHRILSDQSALSALLPPWVPWWMEGVEGASEVPAEINTDSLVHIPHTLSDELPYHLLNILLPTVIALRLYGGDLTDLPDCVYSSILNHSLVLQSSSPGLLVAPLDLTSEALHSALLPCSDTHCCGTASSLSFTSLEPDSIISDLLSIILHETSASKISEIESSTNLKDLTTNIRHSYLRAVLSELYRLCKIVRKSCADKNKRAEIYKVERKVLFFIAYSKTEHFKKCLKDLALDLKAEYGTNTVAADDEMIGKIRKKVQFSSKVLIEEVSDTNDSSS